MSRAQTGPVIGMRTRLPVDCLAPAPWELTAIAALLPFYTALDAVLGEDAFEIVNTIGPLWLAVVLFAGAVRMVNIDKTAMWTGLFWFRVATAVYFGIGSIVHNFLNGYTMMQVWRFFFAEKAHIAKFNVITALSVLCVLGAAAAIGWLAPRTRIAAAGDQDGRFLRTVALLFVCCGYPVKYLVIYPQTMGAFGDVVLPGALMNIVWLTPVGLYLLTYWCLRFSPRWFPAAAMLLALDMAAGVLMFSKSEVLLPLLMFVLAVLNYKLSLARLAIAAAMMIFVFQFIEPTASYGRMQLSMRYGMVRTSSFPERLEIISNYFSGDSIATTTEEFQGSLARIAYVHSAAPAIALYDRGKPGNSLDNILVIFIPRILWPDKPVFDMGAEYTRLINGSVTSSTWMGYFAEAYWDFGWFGIPLLMIPLGAIYVAIGRYTLSLIEAGRWLHFPAAFLGMWMGIRVDGVIVSDILASVVVLVAFHFVANAGATMLRRLMPKTRSAAKPGSRPFPAPCRRPAGV